MNNYSTFKFGEFEEVTAWAQYLDHDAAAKICSDRFDHPGPFTVPQPTDWRSYYTTEELRDFAAEIVAEVCGVPS